MELELFPCFDDKRYILDDGINTLAYLHKDTSQESYSLWAQLFYFDSIVIKETKTKLVFFFKCALKEK